MDGVRIPSDSNDTGLRCESNTCIIDEMHGMTTLESLQKLLAEKFDLSASQLQPQSELDKIGLDSLAIIEFMFTIEDEFKIKMPDERVEIKTVQDIVAVVDKLVAEQGGNAA